MIAASLLACAINVAPATMDAVIRVEGGSPTAINVNKLTGPQPHATSVTDAIRITKHYVAAGYTVDMGWSQLNSANLPRLRYTVEDAFDECKNVAAGGVVLSGFYGRAVERFGEGQNALAHALSSYNTGDFQRGFDNGYVGRYYISVPVSRAPSIPVLPVSIGIQVYSRPGL